VAWLLVRLSVCLSGYKQTNKQTNRRTTHQRLSNTLICLFPRENKKMPPTQRRSILLKKRSEETTSLPSSLLARGGGRPARALTTQNNNRLHSYLVDPASSDMLVSKIKPCMCKYKHLYTVKLRIAHYISYNSFEGHVVCSRQTLRSLHGYLL